MHESLPRSRRGPSLRVSATSRCAWPMSGWCSLSLRPPRIWGASCAGFLKALGVRCAPSARVASTNLCSVPGVSGPFSGAMTGNSNQGKRQRGAFPESKKEPPEGGFPAPGALAPSGLAAGPPRFPSLGRLAGRGFGHRGRGASRQLPDAPLRLRELGRLHVRDAEPVDPGLVLGKPAPHLHEALLRELHAAPARVLHAGPQSLWAEAVRVSPPAAPSPRAGFRARVRAGAPAPRTFLAGLHRGASLRRPPFPRRVGRMDLRAQGRALRGVPLSLRHLLSPRARRPFAPPGSLCGLDRVLHARGPLQGERGGHAPVPPARGLDHAPA